MQSAEITKKLDTTVLAVLGSNVAGGFEKAHAVALAIDELEGLMTNDYMKPIMKLQGNKLGFRTDKDKTGGYEMAVVRRCLIEAVLVGLQPAGNQFNIIAGKMYPTKEGCGYLLNRFPGLQYQIVCGLPQINKEKTGAAVEVTINWKYAGHTNQQLVPFPIKIDQYASVDSIIGKATRKARAWLLSTITGVEITSGDVEDATPINVESTVRKSTAQMEEDRMKQLISTCETLDELHSLQNANPDLDINMFGPLFKEQESFLKARSNG